jgi:hypothetical protein
VAAPERVDARGKRAHDDGEGAAHDEALPHDESRMT